MLRMIENIFGILFVALLILVSFVGDAVDLAMSWNANNINFDRYINAPNILYEYGTTNDVDVFLYEGNTNKTSVYKQKIFKAHYDFQNENAINKICINEETGDEYCFDYYISAFNNNKVNTGIRRINKKENIDEIIWNNDLLKEEYNDNEIALFYLNYSQVTNELFFYFKENGEAVLSKFDLTSGIYTRIINYKAINYNYLFYHTYNYVMTNNNIFVINTNSQLCIYNILKRELTETDCKVYNFAVSKDEKSVYLIDLMNNLCVYDIDNQTMDVILKLDNNVERIDVDKNKNFILCVETLKNKSTLFGGTTSHTYRQNELNLYEISTKSCQTIKKSGMFKVLFDAKFVDTEQFNVD